MNKLKLNLPKLSNCILKAEDIEASANTYVEKIGITKAAVALGLNAETGGNINKLIHDTYVGAAHDTQKELSDRWLDEVDRCFPGIKEE